MLLNDGEGWIRGLYSCLLMLWTHDYFKFVERHGVHLAILECNRFSSIPNPASPVRTVSSFGPCMPGTVGLPAVDKFKGYADRNPAFASFFTTSAIFSKIWINIVFWSCNLSWKINGFFLTQSLLHVTPNRYDSTRNPFVKHAFDLFPNTFFSFLRFTMRLIHAHKRRAKKNINITSFIFPVAPFDRLFAVKSCPLLFESAYKIQKIKPRYRNIIWRNNY